MKSMALFQALMLGAAADANAMPPVIAAAAAYGATYAVFGTAVTLGSVLFSAAVNFATSAAGGHKPLDYKPPL